ncbi:abortive infection protein [Streptomyces sp. NPDC058308]|uniref:abortive infection protein n=1 Tax=Streptomyces sp. NPDC058308 TaxID=3346440 RepID=UPI0036ED13A1
MRDDTAGLVWKGINYDTGTNYAGSGLSRKPSSSDLIHQYMAVIRNDLNCTSVSLFGTDISRLTETASAALDLGLHVSLQPRLIEAEPDAMLRHLAAVATAAEELRQQYGRVVLNVGCELTVFGSGIIPGGTHADRSAKLADPQWWPRFPEFNEKLNGVLARARDVARAHFGGRLTYGAGLWEEVDWDGFDMVGLNYYRMAYNDADYATNLRRFHQYGKPILITEFGCCSFDGAAEMGPAGYGIVDWTADPPELAGSFIRNEQVQADYLSQQLDVFAAEKIYGAYVFEFIAPKPYSPNPRHDLDMASFGVVRVVGDGWEPKAAFHALAGLYSSH